MRGIERGGEEAEDGYWPSGWPNNRLERENFLLIEELGYLIRLSVLFP